MARLARFVTRDRPARADGEPKLPLGAEAALWSIVEVVPHPRNHLALTRDLSGEVRLTDGERAEINAAFDSYVAGTSAATTVESDESIVDVRDRAVLTVDVRYDLGVIYENAPLTDNLFTASNR